MTTALPDRPDLDQLRRRAEDLLNAARSNDQRAVERIRVQLSLPAGAELTLAAAQLVIAREHGLGSWPALEAEVRARTAGLFERLAELVSASVQGHFDPPANARGWSERARRLLAEQPDIAGYDIRIAAVLGEAGQVRRMLADDPGIAVRADDRAGWPPLLFVCSSRWHQIDPARSEGLVDVARLLLDAGADPNSKVGRSPRSGPCSALYAAAGLANHPALAQLLLDHGADPDTPAALYHTAFHPDVTCLRLLLNHGARKEGIATLGAAISVGSTEAIRLLLQTGVDPTQPIPADALAEAPADEPPIPVLRAAIRFRCDAETIDMLLTHGAAAQGNDNDLSPYRLAVRQGDTAIAETLLRHGAHDDTTAIDRFVGACARADHAAVRALLDAIPALMSQLSTQDHSLLVEAAEHTGIAPVTLMLDLGFPPDTPRDVDGATALHVAAHAGRADVVQLLIERGADVGARDTEYHATPLSWAIVGSGHPPRHHPDGDWVATIQTLLDADPPLDGGWHPAKPPSDEVAALLVVHGIAPADD
jgi:ankyrin repeat protein